MPSSWHVSAMGSTYLKSGLEQLNWRKRAGGRRRVGGGGLEVGMARVLVRAWVGSGTGSGSGGGFVVAEPSESTQEPSWGGVEGSASARARRER